MMYPFGVIDALYLDSSTHLAMSSKMFTLYDPFKINLDLVKKQQFAQEIVYYGES
jgi:hypothetical protein